MKKILLNTVNTKSPNYRKYSALVDDEDFERVNQFKWSAQFCNNGIKYALRKDENRVTVKMHTFITGYKITDHKNYNGLDNRKKNLRKATSSQNKQNQRPRKDSILGYKGIGWKRNSYYVDIQFKGKRFWLGYFKELRKAVLAYNKKAKELFGEFAYLNKIPKN